MTRYFATASLIAASSCFVAGDAAAASVTLKDGLNGYAGTDDNTLIQNNNGGSGNFGGRNEILLGATGSGGQRAGLIRFDTTSLDGLYTSIDSMKLRFTVFRESSDNTYGVRLMKEGNAGWVEGTSNGTIETGASSWNYLDSETVEWLGGQSGARFINTDNYGNAGSFTLTSGTTPVGTVVEINIDPSSLDASVDTLTKVVDLWNSSGGANNGGFQIYGGNGQWGVDSSESSELGERPELVIEYTPVPEPSSLALIGLAGLLVARRRRGK